MKNFLGKLNIPPEKHGEFYIRLTALLTLAGTLIVGRLLGFEISTTLTVSVVVMFSVILLLTLFVANFVVMRALFHISAGLSLVIFLAQSYCDVEVRTPEGDSALALLVFFGIGYVIFDFSKILRKGVKDSFEKFPDKKTFGYYLICVLVLLFVVSLLSLLIHVTVPIFNDLCIYQPL